MRSGLRLTDELDSRSAEPALQRVAGSVEQLQHIVNTASLTLFSSKSSDRAAAAAAASGE
jgi:hypothetical protein